MAKSDRRTFLKRSAAAVPAIALGPEAAASLYNLPQSEAAPGSPTTLDAVLLGAVGAAVLPIAELGANGVSQAVRDFQEWLTGYEPVAELNHSYFSAEIGYAPADPGPRWQSQLEALDAEARKRHEVGFTELGPADQQTLLARHIGREGASGLPGPVRADHVAVGLLAWFYATSRANDLCYGARIRKQECRGLEGVGRPPEPTP